MPVFRAMDSGHVVSTWCCVSGHVVSTWCCVSGHEVSIWCCVCSNFRSRRIRIAAFWSRGQHVVLCLQRIQITKDSDRCILYSMVNYEEEDIEVNAAWSVKVQGHCSQSDSQLLASHLH